LAIPFLSVFDENSTVEFNLFKSPEKM
jgi:hypothetical protein